LFIIFFLINVPNKIFNIWVKQFEEGVAKR
jgi:hypothetical protein